MRFLIDSNLPYFFSIWNNPDCIHLKDIDETLSDSAVWEYAKKNNLIIVSKDADFYNRILVSTPPPKVIHIKTWNLTLKNLYAFLSKVWPDVTHMIQSHKLVNVFTDRLEGIS